MATTTKGSQEYFTATPNIDNLTLEWNDRIFTDIHIIETFNSKGITIVRLYMVKTIVMKLSEIFVPKVLLKLNSFWWRFTLVVVVIIVIVTIVTWRNP